MERKRITVFTGAGVSAGSGIKTFRDADGLWEGHRVEEIAYIGAWHTNRENMTRFYDERRKQLAEVEPNDAHLLIAKLEERHDVTVITQNVDDLHERAGSTNVIHLHGELKKVCNEDKTVIKDIGYQEAPTEFENGETVRPYIVWFGENLDMSHIEKAEARILSADVLIIIGTSLQVEPAASMIQDTQDECAVYYIDPGDHDPHVPEYKREFFHRYKEGAVSGMNKLYKELTI